MFFFFGVTKLSPQKKEEVDEEKYSLCRSVETEEKSASNSGKNLFPAECTGSECPDYSREFSRFCPKPGEPPAPPALQRWHAGGFVPPSHTPVFSCDNPDSPVAGGGGAFVPTSGQGPQGLQHQAPLGKVQRGARCVGAAGADWGPHRDGQ